MIAIGSDHGGFDLKEVVIRNPAIIRFTAKP